MVAGYQFKGQGSTKDVRQFMNLQEVYNPAGERSGKMAVIHVAQDDKEWNELQTDTRLKYDVYDQALAKATRNTRGVDSTVYLTDDQWTRIVESGDIVKGDSYEYLDRQVGTVKREQPEYLAFQSDILLAHDGPRIMTDTIQTLDEPLDIAKHGSLTSAKINEFSPAEQARRAINRRMEREEEALRSGIDPDRYVPDVDELDR